LLYLNCKREQADRYLGQENCSAINKTNPGTVGIRECQLSRWRIGARERNAVPRGNTNKPYEGHKRMIAGLDFLTIRRDAVTSPNIEERK
jgi:hypothetical protein